MGNPKNQQAKIKVEKSQVAGLANEELADIQADLGDGVLVDEQAEAKEAETATEPTLTDTLPAAAAEAIPPADDPDPLAPRKPRCILIEIPIAEVDEVDGYQSKPTRHVDLQLDREQERTLRQIYAGVSKGDFHLKNKRRNVHHHGTRVLTKPDAVRWLLEQVANAIAELGKVS